MRCEFVFFVLNSKTDHFDINKSLYNFIVWLNFGDFYDSWQFLVFQFSQQSYGYSLSQPQPQIGQANLTQPNMFLPTTLSQHELYQTSQLTGYQPRNQPYGQTAGQQNTVMVSSATTSLMSTAVKPPTQDYS